ncbi:membrane-bound lytic murein transglycosylase A precursor [Variibacter gotjawalensis]|uniref:peptidoglycan lytic exotransglycosylase n=1 Tax=Variibacter gotjawalensis TaxID=1333996 RepID=A0A0S3PQL3_9BRAD|nr:MltA domain-containing protein [Variibacter gotjawalensis]NIK48536.1 membrane-bound lytic murein transglycosylase A [Variibacter gotjawalensis]RZS50401.1 membrane-bound lytic murein transglycosylase A [Variibacter gotjawalensis]BAT58235.1 membrane-bound lytic murein transglycosylase A precursor [Variibacter gotjawalensis]
MRLWAALLTAALLAPNAAAATDWTLRGALFVPLQWSEIEGWRDDDHLKAYDTFLNSCRHMTRPGAKIAADAKPLEKPLARICRHALRHKAKTATRARKFFEKEFRPVRIRRLGEQAGFLTGYYEPIIEGSRTKSDEFPVPVYGRPKDLVSAVEQTGPDFPNRGGVLRITETGERVPYYDRGAIEDGALTGKNLELVWLRDPVDLFFTQIQGSARVRLKEGGTMRINYAAHNGQPYTAVGGLLVRDGRIPREEISMDRIRAWMAANPEEAKALRRANRAYVFFRVVDNLPEDQEAIGAQSIPLVAGRSLAVDRNLHVYGTPFWIDAMLPLTAEKSQERYRRLMIGQDTGSAILGPARGDLYFGAGDEMGRVAGRIRHPAEWVMLVPKSLRPKTIIPDVPMPRPRPAAS